jgi:hypothetical protein
MTENIQQGFISELLDVLKLLTIFVIRRLNLQHILYLTAFLTFGLGDGITAAFMMAKLGPSIEANPIIGYIFTVNGFDGVVFAKMWMTFIILVAVYIAQLKSYTDIYWTVNGFLIALTAGGLMAINANLSAIANRIPEAPSEIIFVYLFLMAVLIEIGSFIDRRMGMATTD